MDLFRRRVRSCLPPPAVSLRWGGHRSSQDEKTWVERRHAGCLREDPALCNIPVVIMSSLPEGNLSESAKDMYTAFLRKPFRRKAVIDVVNAVLGRRG